MGGRSQYDYAGWTPHKDNHGQFGTSKKRLHSIWAVYLRGTNATYSSTMTADETFVDPENIVKCYFLDPNGAKRTFNPSGTFNTGALIFVKNIGTTFSVVFDAGVSKKLIRPGQLGIFMYDGTIWR